MPLTVLTAFFFESRTLPDDLVIQLGLHDCKGNADAQLQKRGLRVTQTAGERARLWGQPLPLLIAPSPAKPSSRDGIPHAGFKSCHTEGLLFAASIAIADRRHENFW